MVRRSRPGAGKPLDSTLDAARRRKVHYTRNSLAGIARYVPLLLLSKPDPLRWAPVWGRPSAAIRAQPRGAAAIHRPPWPDK